MLMLAVLVFGLLLTLGVSRVGVAIIGRARADTAADAAALAAADSLALGRGPAAAAEAARDDRGKQRRAARVVRVRGNHG